MSSTCDSCGNTVPVLSTQNVIDTERLNRRVFVGNVSYKVNRKQLMEFFSQFGEVTYCYMVNDHVTKRRKGTAFITFKEAEVVNKVLGLPDDVLVFDNRQMHVSPAEESERWKLRQYNQPKPDLDISECRISTEAVDSQTDDTSDTTKSDDIITDTTQTCDSTQSDDIIDTDNCAIHQLTDDALTAVFCYLTVKDRIRSERVCKRWKRVCRESWLCVRFLQFAGLFSGFNGLTDRILQSVLSKGCRNLISLDVSASARHLTEKSMEIIARYCERLEVLNIDGVRVTNKSMEIFAKRCSTLKWLSVQRCYIGEDGMWWVLHKNRSLEYINMCDNPQITGQCFHMLGDKLTVIHLTDCIKMTDVGIQKLAERSHNLSGIYLSKCWNLSNVALQSLSQNCTDLKVLHLPYRHHAMTCEGLAQHINFPNLEELNVSQNPLMTDTVISSVAANCLHIKTLNISNCNMLTTSGLCTLSDFVYLEYLDVSYILQFTDIVLQTIANKCNLTSLLARACVHLTDVSLVCLAQGCDSLQKLDVSSCMEVTNNAINAFSVCREISDDVTPLDIVVGGTSVVVSKLDIPPWLYLEASDYSQMALRIDREIVLPPEILDEDEWGDVDEYNDVVPDDDTLMNDDPLAQDDYDVS